MLSTRGFTAKDAKCAKDWKAVLPRSGHESCIKDVPVHAAQPAASSAYRCRVKGVSRAVFAARRPLIMHKGEPVHAAQPAASSAYRCRIKGVSRAVFAA